MHPLKKSPKKCKTPSRGPWLRWGLLEGPEGVIAAIVCDTLKNVVRHGVLHRLSCDRGQRQRDDNKKIKLALLKGGWGHGGVGGRDQLSKNAVKRRTKSTRKRNTPENAGNRPFPESAFSGVLRFQVCCVFGCSLAPANKRLTKPKNRTNSTKEFSEQFEGFIGSLPNKTRVLRQITPESSPERSANSLSHSFFVVPFLSPISCDGGVQSHLGH